MECVVKRGGKTAFRVALKTCHFFDFIFVAFPKWDSGDVEKTDFSTSLLTKDRERLRSK